MDFLVQFKSFFYFFVIALSLLLGIWVYLSDRKNKINLFFFLLSLAMVLYLVASYVSHFSNNFELALISKKLIYANISLFVIFAYFFSIYFPKEGKRHFLLDKVVVIVQLLFFVLIAFSDFLVKGIHFESWGTGVVWGVGKNIWYGVLVLFIFLIVAQFLIKYFSLSSKKKLQIQYFVAGILVFSLLNLIFNIIVPLWQNTYKYYIYGNSSTIFFLGLTAYAIVKKKLFGIKVILTDFLIVTVAIILFANIFVSVNWLEYAWNTMIFLIFGFFGFFLIRSTWRRMRAREQIQRYAKKLQRANKRLQKLDQQKTEFISFAAHQLRAPLTSVRGFASLILDDSLGKTPPKVKDAVKNIFDSSTSMINSVEDYLNITRIEQDRMEYDMTTFDLYEVAQAVVDELQPHAYKKKIDLSISSDRNKSYNVRADQGKIKQVINNLVENAVKYTQEGGVKVYLSHQRKRKMIRLSVSDSGIGMSRQTIKKLFQKYSRAQNTEGIQGTGLGLFIAKRMVEAQNGKVWAESPGEGKGSTFYLELPCLRKK